MIIMYFIFLVFIPTVQVNYVILSKKSVDSKEKYALIQNEFPGEIGSPLRSRFAPQFDDAEGKSVRYSHI